MDEPVAEPAQSLITIEQMKRRVMTALTIERLLLRVGWAVLGLAIVGLIVVIVLWLTGSISVDQALAGIFGVVISAILSGAAAVGSGINVGLGASRLVLNLRDAEKES